MAYEALFNFLAEQSDTLGSGTGTELSAEVSHAPVDELVPAPGKVDGVDGGFVDDDGNRYWVSGPGHYQYTYDAHGNVVDRKWIPNTEALKAFRLA